MPSFEQTADTGMVWNVGEEEEVVKTLLPNVPLWGAIFKPLRFSECLYSDMSFICRRKD